MIYREIVGDIIEEYEGTPEEIQEMRKIKRELRSLDSQSTNFAINEKASDKLLKELKDLKNDTGPLIAIDDTEADITKRELCELEELSRPIVDYLRKKQNPHCEVVISNDSIRLVATELGIPIKDHEEPCVCDGKFTDKQTFHGPCEGNAKYIARKNIDDMECIYHCCNNCRYSYESEGFITEEL